MGDAIVDSDDPGTMTLPTDDVPPGEYTWWIGFWYADDVMHGGKTVGTVAVLPVIAPDSVITLTLPASLTRIEEEAFSGLTAQKVIINAAGSVSIDPRAFANSSVIVVEVPVNVSFAPDGDIIVVTRYAGLPQRIEGRRNPET